MQVTNDYLQQIIDGKIGVIDSTQAVAVAKELLAARTFLEAYENSSHYAEIDEIFDEFDKLAAWRKAAE